ncbi:MAG: response regulator transcription factor [Nitrosomonas sp.]|nr:response regulator transcription factor [Nitrosomonas sp.]
MMEKTQHKIRLVVAERIDLVRMGLRMLFQNHPVISMLGETGSIDGLSDLITTNKPDVILMDLGLINDRCPEHRLRLMNIGSHSRILLFSHHYSHELQSYELPPGVTGIISKYSPSSMLVAAICKAHINRRCADMTNPALTRAPQSPEQVTAQPSLPGEITASLHPELNNNERRVARLAGKGLSAREISRQLLLTEKTVRNYLSAVYKKMGVKKQIELCLRAPLHNYFQD